MFIAKIQSVNFNTKCVNHFLKFNLSTSFSNKSELKVQTVKLNVKIWHQNNNISQKFWTKATRSSCIRVCIRASIKSSTKTIAISIGFCSRKFSQTWRLTLSFYTWTICMVYRVILVKFSLFKRYTKLLWCTKYCVTRVYGFESRVIFCSVFTDCVFHSHGPVFVLNFIRITRFSQSE